MIADKSINLDTLHKVLFDNEKLKLSEECWSLLLDISHDDRLKRYWIRRIITEVRYLWKWQCPLRVKENGSWKEPSKLVPTDWLEQTTYRLQGGCSTTELSGLTENLNSTHFLGFVLSPDLKK